jgi:hypothetical protein
MSRVLPPEKSTQHQSHIDHMGSNVVVAYIPWVSTLNFSGCPPIVLDQVRVVLFILRALYFVELH